MITAYSLSVYKIIKSLLNSCFRKLFKLKILIIGHLRDKQSVNHTACLSNRLLFLAANKMEHSYYYTNGICTCTYVTTTNWLNNIISRWREIWPFSSTDFSQGWVFFVFWWNKSQVYGSGDFIGNWQFSTFMYYLILDNEVVLHNSPRGVSALQSTNQHLYDVHLCM